MILASKSPRRKDLLKTAGFEFEIIPSTINEKKIQQNSPKEYAKKVAYKKSH